MALFADIEKQIGDFHLQVSFEAGDEVFSILGASGCGKSMTLKCIAGIERPDRGRIVLDGITLFDSERHIDLKPQQRRVGYLFQQYALFPNMTVRENIRCGILGRNRGTVSGAGDVQIQEMIARMHLEGLEDLRPAQLSGGPQQRAALARILISEPQILMLDEPFSALDSHLRFQMEREVDAVARQFGKTVLLISHDRDEVFRMTDGIAIMENGQLHAVGSRYEVFRDPKTVSGARLTGCKNIAEIGSTAGGSGTEGSGMVDVPLWGIRLKTASARPEATHVGVRMHDVHILEPGKMPRRDQGLAAVPDSRQDRKPIPGDGREDTSRPCTEETANIFRCRVTEEIENPFSYTVMLLAEGGREPFGMEVNKHKWDACRRQELDVYIPPQAVLLIKG